MEVSLAFAAGVLSFVSPCVLALVPVYLAYLGETAASVGRLPAAVAGGPGVRAAVIDRRPDLVDGHVEMA